MPRWHTIQETDSLASLAAGARLASYRAIWEHRENAALKEERRNPWTLMPGDRVFIPDPEPRTVQAGTGQVHRFRIRRPPTVVRAIVRQADGQPCAHHPFVLEVEGETFEGETDGAGLLTQAVPAEAQEGTLTVWMFENDTEVERRWTLALGVLPPLDEVRGVQSRLRNLGLLSGEPTGELDTLTVEALKVFQKRQGLEVTGASDAPTVGRLEAVYGR